MADSIPDSVKEQMLADPKVQELIKKSGKSAAEALKDPEVQKQILASATEKFPEYAAKAKENIAAFVNDPKVQEQAKAALGQASEVAKKAAGLFVAQIEQGPAGIRIFGFIGGVASCVNAVMSMMNPLMLVFGPVMYVLSTYQLIFALTTMLFEAKPEWIQKIPGLDGYQDMLMDKCKFLTETLGRGLFYIFQGTLWLCFASLDEPLDLAVGAGMVFVGLLNILIHFGGFSHFAEKVSGAYKSLSTEDKETPLIAEP